MKCNSCGMPMESVEDHGASDENNPFCAYCADDGGNLRSRDEVRDSWIRHVLMQSPLTRTQASIRVESVMRTMPAWRE